jgi:hypothetical protein
VEVQDLPGSGDQRRPSVDLEQPRIPPREAHDSLGSSNGADGVEKRVDDTP